MRRTAALMILTMIGISAVGVLAILPANTTAESHDPIYINGDAGFEAVVAVSGVRSGTGVEGDPYIISDWEIIIETSVVNEHGVWIRDTDKHFVIRNVTVSQTSYHATLNFNGIDLWNANNGTVENCTLTGWLKKGIYTHGSSDVFIRNNTVSVESGPSNDRIGIEVYSSPCVNITVDGNNVTTCDYGVKVGYADDVTVKNNNVSSVSNGGILIQSSEEATVWNNTMTGCGVDLWVGSLAESNSHLIPQNNTVNGLPVHYVMDDADVAYDGESVGQLIFANCVGVTVSDMSFSACDVGIQVYYCEDVSLSGVTVTDTLYNGVTVGYTDDFNMTDSVISGCGRDGLELWSGTGFVIAGCTIESNQLCGIYIAYSQQVNVTLCSISFNDGAAGSCGIDYRVMNTAIDTQSTITYNEFRENNYGVSLSGCMGVTVHHNNFVDNTVQALDSETDLNQWDDGAEGNYWSDYSGTDSEPDGIGDTSYDIDGDTFDDYPLFNYTPIPEFGDAIVPVLIVLGLFGWLSMRKRKEGR